MKEGERISQRTYVQDKDKDKDNSLVMALGEEGTGTGGRWAKGGNGDICNSGNNKNKVKKIKRVNFSSNNWKPPINSGLKETKVISRCGTVLSREFRVPLY